MRRKLLAVAVVGGGAGVAIAAGCSAFDSDPAADPNVVVDAAALPPSEPEQVEIDAGVVDPADATAPLPLLDAAAGCVAAGTPLPPATLLFCSDFDKGTLEPWRKARNDVGFIDVVTEAVSPEHGAGTATEAGTSSSSARLERRVTSGTRLVVSGNIDIKASDSTGWVQLVKLQLLGVGSVILRSDGSLVESRKGSDGNEQSNRSAGRVNVPRDTWQTFTVVLDLGNHTAKAVVGSTEAALNLDPAKVPTEVDVLLGPGEPTAPDKGWRVLWDNITAVSD
jgi:hypothetical protein